MLQRLNPKMHLTFVTRHEDSAFFFIMFTSSFFFELFTRCQTAALQATLTH